MAISETPFKDLTINNKSYSSHILNSFVIFYTTKIETFMFYFILMKMSNFQKYSYIYKRKLILTNCNF